MPRFRFSLEPLLEARRRAEQRHQRAVAAIEAQRMSIETQLRRQQMFISRSKSDVREHLTGPIDMQNLRMQASSTMQLLRNAQRLALELAGVHKRLEAARAELIGAAKQRRAAELLRDRRYAQWKAAENKRDAQMIDELAVIAAARRSQDGKAGVGLET